MDLKDDADKSVIESVKNWNQAIKQMEDKNFIEARQLFEKFKEQNPDDKTADLYIKRCVSFIQEPPSPDWDGVFNLTEK